MGLNIRGVTIVVRSQRSRFSRQWAVRLSCALCALCALVTRVEAQLGSQGQTTLPPASFSPGQVDDELKALRGELEQARFTVAAERAQSLLAQPRLSARQRNCALELLAIAQIAARADTAAEGTLRELYARDPDHVAGVRDPGPNVAAMFERVRSQTARTLSVPLTLTAQRDAEGRVIVEVALGVGHDAVDSVHVFARSGAPADTSPRGEARSDPTRQPSTDAAAPSETSHLVADVGVRTSLALALPPAGQAASSFAVYVEARAPSGSVLGRDGSASAPLVVRLDAQQRCADDLPGRRRWWVWTGIALAVTGIAIGGALAAH